VACRALYSLVSPGISMSNTSYIICVAVAAWLAFLVISDFP
jgi:hypothetical protein